MRISRTILALGVMGLLLSTGATAQSEPVFEVTTPLARQPDGRLPLEGTPWRLTAYHYRDREGFPGPEVAAFIEFGAGRFDGSGGCSRVRGQYGVNGSAVSLGLRRPSERTCAENVALVQQAVESGLKGAAAYRIEPGTTAAEDELVLYSVTGEELLRYGLDDLASLDGVQWRLESYTSDGEVVAASEEMPALLAFRPEADASYRRRQSGSLTGSSGCNGVVSDFVRHSDVVTFSQLEVTDAPCTSELAAQEAAVTELLAATAIRIDLPYDRLILTSADTGARLELVSQEPLEGSTWWLRSTAADGDVGDQRITLRLEDGIAGGEGPCGPYSAGYVTDGFFVTFSDAKGTRDEDCAVLRTEQALISGLRRSVAVARTADGLAFRDARGETTLSFDRAIAP